MGRQAGRPPAPVPPGRNDSNRVRGVCPPGPIAAAADGAASATRSHTETASRPVSGAANGRLTRQATGPVLAILTDCWPPCFCVLSNWMLTPLRGDGPVGNLAVAGRRLLKTRIGHHVQRRGLRSAAARAPSRRICAPSAASTVPGQATCGLEHCTSGSDNCTATRSYGSSSTSQHKPPGASGLSGSIFRLPLSSSMRQSGPPSTWTRAVTAKGASLTAYRYVRPPYCAAAERDRLAGVVALAGCPPAGNGPAAARDRRPPARGAPLPGPSAASSRRRPSPAHRAWPGYGRTAADFAGPTATAGTPATCSPA